jgi:alkanesulfonate monooxygenase SsuD/methylene tetrahydromethanopterin reductase-like flavin-dependent oxidoreductase (luciferase family)
MWDTKQLALRSYIPHMIGADLMKFGVTFFPDCWPAAKSGAQYFAECLHLAEQAAQLGFQHVKTVEYYFHPYGGYSPNPIVFLAAISQRAPNIRLVTGAVLPVFSHPLKLASELAMLDCISQGRLDVGVARAFVPREFEAFGVSLEESRARFEEGIAALIRLWTEEEVTFEGQFHRFHRITILPRPVQRPHPPLYVAAVSTLESFIAAGRAQCHLMIVPYLSDFSVLASLLKAYRTSFADSSGGKLPRPVMTTFHMYCAPTPAAAEEDAREYMQTYISTMKHAVSGWIGRSSSQYPGYSKLVETLDCMTYDRILAEDRAIIGDPDQCVARLARVKSIFVDIEPSFQINFGMMPLEKAQASLELFAREVIPVFKELDL